MSPGFLISDWRFTPQKYFEQICFFYLNEEKGKKDWDKKKKEREKWKLEACGNIFLLNPSELSLLHLKLHG